MEKFSRRDFLMYTGATGAVLALGAKRAEIPEESNSKPLVTLIRWDGWFPGNRWQNNLQNPLFYDNLPFFAKVASDGRVVVEGSDPEILEQQDYDSKRAGIDGYAAVYYDPEGPCQDYNYYTNFCRPQQPSPDAPKYSLILQGMHVGNAGNWPHFNDILAKHFESERYLTTPDGDPILHVFFLKAFENNFKDSDEPGKTADGAKRAIDYLRQRVWQQLSKRVVLVAQNPEVVSDVSAYDAVSAYTTPETVTGPAPYSALAVHNRIYWDVLRSKNKIVVPNLNMAWDPRGRFNDPETQNVYVKGSFYAPPTPEEFANHIQSSFNWLQQNPQTLAMILANSLNEYDESGKTLSRLLNQGTVYLDAMRGVIQRPFNLKAVA